MITTAFDGGGVGLLAATGGWLAGVAVRGPKKVSGVAREND